MKSYGRVTCALQLAGPPCDENVMLLSCARTVLFNDKINDIEIASREREKTQDVWCVSPPPFYPRF